MNKIGIKKIGYTKRGSLSDTFFNRGGNQKPMFQSFVDIPDFVEDTAFLSEESIDDDKGLSFKIVLNFTIRKNIAVVKDTVKALLGKPLIFAITGIDNVNYVIGTNDYPAYLSTDDVYDGMNVKELICSVEYINLDGLLKKSTLVDTLSIPITIDPHAIDLSWKGGYFTFAVITENTWQLVKNRDMAKFISVEKSGSNVVGSAAVHTGRVQRTDTVQVTTIGGAEDEGLVVQSPKPEFVEITSSSPISLKPDATSFVVYAKSNSSKLTVTFPTNGVGAVVNGMIANSNAITSGMTILGDPGAEKEYVVEISCSCKGNNMAASTISIMRITDSAGNTAEIEVNQAGATPEISISPASVNVPAAGGTFTFTVESNDEWNVTAAD